MRAEPSLIRPKPFKDFGAKTVVYIPVDSPSGLVTRHLGQTAEKTKLSEWGTLAKLKDKVVLYRAMGAPLAVMTLERLIASGAQEILVLGFCGSLDPRLRIGSAVNVTRAFADEGTSGHYFPRRAYFRSSSSLSSKIEDLLAAARLPVVRAAAVSTDAPFRETSAWLRSMVRRGCRVADMETSAVFALAEFHRREAASLMIVSDELSGTAWRHGFFESGLEESVRRHFLPFL